MTSDNVMTAGEYCEEYERVTGTPAPSWLVASMAATQGSMGDQGVFMTLRTLAILLGADDGDV